MWRLCGTMAIMPDNNILTVTGLGVQFGGDAILEDINFSIERGEGLAVIGPNGAGKTVLIRALLGMVPYKGAIAWAPDVHLGYVPQKIDADRHLPINAKNLLTAKAAVLRPALTERDIDATIRATGLDERTLSTPVGHLSGGQFQRALIAFALLGKPNVLILDEPTASIDKPGEEQIYELVHRLQDDYGMTIILVSHDLSFVYRYATKVLCINKTGLCFGPPEEALTPGVLEKLYGPHKYFHHYHHMGEPDADHNHRDHYHA
jgi:zinc transport system ATP-binding protein